MFSVALSNNIDTYMAKYNLVNRLLPYEKVNFIP